MNTSTLNPAGPRGRLQFLLLATLFFFPLLLSYALYFWFPQFQPSGRTNYGELVDPARPLETLQLVDVRGATLDAELLRGRWTYLVHAVSDCDEACLSALVMTRQVRLAANEKRSRIQRVLVLDDATALPRVAAALAGQHPDLQVVADRGAAGQRVADFFGGVAATCYLFDPHANWVLSYRGQADTQTEFKGMQKDLHKLLRISQIG